MKSETRAELHGEELLARLEELASGADGGRLSGQLIDIAKVNKGHQQCALLLCGLAETFSREVDEADLRSVLAADAIALLP